MKHVVRYLLEGDGTIPKFIEDGGYFQLGEELVGISVDDTKRHLPSTVFKLTQEDLSARIISMNLSERGGSPLTVEQCQQMAADFFSQKGI